MTSCSSVPRTITICPDSSRRADDLDDLLLRLLHLLHPHRAHELQVLADVGGGALAHVAEDGVLDLVARALERDRQLLGVHLAQHLLDAAVVERDDVLEEEHHAADLLGQLGVLALERLEDRALGAAVHLVEQVDQRLAGRRPR